MPLRLRIVSKNAKSLGANHEQVFAEQGGTIGRGLDNDWVLPDPERYISGRHAMIDFQGGAYYLVDTSRNGVFINDADTPVGRGHPQRLFDGDRLRLGNFEILVAMQEAEAEPADLNPVVRAQQVPEDPSLELAMVDEQKMVEADALARHVTASDASAQLSQLSEVIALPVAARAESQENAATTLLSAAGIEPRDVAGTPPADILRAAGGLLRAMVIGLTALLQERAEVKEQFRISQTLIKREQNNPLKFSPGVNEALASLLSNNSKSYLPAEEAVEASFADIKQHEAAVMKAMGSALKDFMERLDPEELQSTYDRGLKRSSLLAGANKLKYWELYAESYHVLTHQEDGRLPELFSEEFARAYEEAVKAGARKRRAS